MTRSKNGKGSSLIPTDPPPRIGTPRNLERKTLGGKAARVAAQLGTPYMPWQRHVADVGLEIDPATGSLWYREIVLVVPRQSGKTTIVLTIAVHRALAWLTPQRIVYAAQTGLDARNKFADDHVPALDASPLGKRRPKLYKVRRRAGQEAILWANGSKHGLIAGTEKAGHGQVVDLGFTDELFSQVDDRLEQFYGPAMITRADPQLWGLSTVGKSQRSSPVLWRKMEACRERLAQGEPSRIAYFEWSASDEDDRGDVDVWRRVMPALGHTISIDAVRAEFESMSPAEFDRAFLNRWTPQAVSSPIDEDDWKAGARSQGMAGRLVFGVDMSPDRAWTTVIGVGDAIGTEGAAGEVVAVDRGTDWVVGRVARLVAAHGATAVGVDATGPAAAFIPDLESEGLPVVKVGGTDMGRAFGGLVDAVTGRRLVHRNQAELNVAVDNAVTRQAGDTVRLSRTSSPVDISPLVALAVAHWVWRQAPEPVEYTAEPDFVVV